MYLQFRLWGRNRSQAKEMLSRTRLAHRRRRGQAGVLAGWREEYRWDTVFVVALVVWLFVMGLWVTTHPID
jgi:phage shock protein PspC (stress-responsive transcriptional regulator)